MDVVNIYLGCDLFIEGQRWQALRIQRAIEEELGSKVNIYNPAENLEINDKNNFSFGTDILLADYERLQSSDMLIALMDTGDLGLAVEMGIAWERGIPVFQLYTDIRLLGADNKDKHEQTGIDVFQNDILYLNKLMTALSYVDKNRNKYVKPLIYRDSNKLTDSVISFIKQEFS